MCVWFGTTRRSQGGTNWNEYFSGARAQDMRLSLGRCEVSIPQEKRFGKLPRPKWWRFEFTEDPAKHVTLLSVEELGPDQFTRSIREEDADSAMVFVHGYNVSFAAAVRQTAQITYDIQFPGLPIVFSWPSRDDLEAYTADEASMEASVASLATFLERICLDSGIERVHLVAHSMGARCLVRAASTLAARTSEPFCRQLVLTAPDIDRDEFGAAAAALAKASARLTLYASSNDLAIRASRAVHGHPRAGESGDNVLILPRIDTVDVSGVNTSLLGHSYHADNTSVVTDLQTLLNLELPPLHRPRIEKLQDPRGAYWRFMP